ncbi:hypothetical protein TWF506_004410 [Arthrobotrys conoides]|uniref:BTB domain-containing protein n=1 Tax=Arthrobotrys conoides TaxID=74498 RepID=A0AAN8N6N3_9PEZI
MAEFGEPHLILRRLIEAYSNIHSLAPDVDLFWEARPLSPVVVRVHRDIVAKYSTNIRSNDSLTDLSPRGRSQPIKIIAPCDSRDTLIRTIGWMYYQEIYPSGKHRWRGTREQLADWPTMLRLFRAAQNLGMEALTVDLSEQLSKALVHHARVLPFEEATEVGVDTSPEAICMFINRVYNYGGKIKMHGLIHMLLSTSNGDEIRDLVRNLGNLENLNQRFFELLESAAEDVELMAREKCSCLWIDRNLRTA